MSTMPKNGFNNNCLPAVQVIQSNKYLATFCWLRALAIEIPSTLLRSFAFAIYSHDNGDGDI